MAVLTLPTTWTTGQVLTAAALNGNFVAVVNAVNNIDNTNIGSAGIFADQILPTNSTQAIFGGSQAYTFPAGISVGGALSGATSGVFSGALTTASITTGSIASGSGSFSNVSASGILIASGTITGAGVVSTAALQTENGTLYLDSVGAHYLIYSASVVTFSDSVQVNGNLATSGVLNVAGTALVNNIALGREPSSGQMGFFVASSAGYIANQTSISFVNDTNSASIPLYAQSFNPTSDIALKSNIQAIPYGLKAILKLQPRSFDWKHTAKGELGFVAQEVAEVIPEVVSSNGQHATLNYNGIVAALTAAVRELAAQVSVLQERLDAQH